MQAPDKIAELIFKHLREELTEDELLELEQWRMESAENESLFQTLLDKENIQRMLKGFYPDKEAAWNKLVKRVPELRSSPVRQMQWLRPVAAAVIVAVICCGVYLYFHWQAKKIPVLAGSTGEFKNDVAPGTDKAILQLANGSTIVLDSAHTGDLAEQGNVKLVKIDSGEIAYTPGGQQPVVSYNTLSTPRGGQYRVILQDGTKVWLNAASSLRFPTAFTGKQRNVELTGEAYFEVEKNPGAPFRVSSGNAQVEVLGTHFNIMSYPDENFVSTTLLEGSVKMSKGANSEIIKPGEQARLNNNSSSINVIQDVDVDVIVAWKNGMTVFKNADLQTIMRTISRWYDVKVVYEGNIPAKSLGGGIPRHTNLSEVLKVLEAYQVHFKLEGKQITIMP